MFDSNSQDGYEKLGFMTLFHVKDQRDTRTPLKRFLN